MDITDRSIFIGELSYGEFRGFLGCGERNGPRHMVRRFNVALPLDTQHIGCLGPIFHVETFGGHLFVINSQKVAMEVLEKNANSIAARPTNMVMATDL